MGIIPHPGPTQPHGGQVCLHQAAGYDTPFLRSLGIGKYICHSLASLENNYPW